MTETATKGERTRARILGAARDLFIVRGIDAVSIRDIAARAGITHALVHRYFGTREQLLRAVIEREIETTGAAIAARSSAAEDPFEGLRQTIAYAFGEGRSIIDLFGQLARAGIAPEAVVPANPVRPFEEMAGTLRSLQQQDGAAPAAPDPAITALVVTAATTALATNAAWLMASVGLDPKDADARRDEIVDEIVRIAASTVTTAREP